MHWAPDEASVAIVDDGRIRVKRLEDGVWITDVAAARGVRFVDFSIPFGLALQWRNGRYELVPLDGGGPRFAASLERAASAQLSEDGTRVVMNVVQVAPEDRIYTQESTGVPYESLSSIDLKSGNVRPIAPPSMSAGGSDTYPRWIRRRAVQVDQSRIASGFFDYVAAPTEDGEVPNMRIESCWGVGDPEGTGAFFGADTDDAFRVVVVARIPCEREPHVPTIEVQRRPRGSADFKLARSWRFDGTFMALWVSPDGGRVIVRTKNKGAITNTVYDTHTGAVRGSLPLGGDCFELSSNGVRLAEKDGADLRVTDVP